MTAQGPYEAIIFDVGGVLLDWNPVPLFTRLFGEIRRAEIMAARLLDDPDMFADMDRGTLTLEGACRRLAERCPEDREAIGRIRDHWHEMVVGPIASNVTLVHHFADAGYRVLGLTNWSDFGMSRLMEKYPFFARFEGVVISGRVHLVKPEPAIYRHLLQTYDLEVGRCLFIDDNPVFVNGARAVGMDAVRFTTPATLRAALTARGLRVPPEGSAEESER